MKLHRFCGFTVVCDGLIIRNCTVSAYCIKQIVITFEANKLNALIREHEVHGGSGKDDND
jgi:hypothetical protein